MKCALLSALALGAVASPVGKVVTMLEAMARKGKEELQEERVQYARYAQWCEATKAEKAGAVEEATGKMEVLKADISKAVADVELLVKELEEHNGQIEKLGAEQSKAKEVREKEATDYEKELKDYTESVEAIDSALETMEKAGVAQLQVGSGRHAQELQRLVGMAKPTAAAYDLQSSNIIDMLKKMQLQFTKEKHELEVAETSKAHSYQLLLASLKSRQEAETEDQERKGALKAKKLGLKASKEDELATTTSSKDADAKYLDDVSATCRQKAADFESNQKLREDELQAIEKAVRIVSERLSLLEVKLGGLLQLRKGTALALLRSVNEERTRAKVLGFLQAAGQRLRSAALTNLLEPVATEALGKVKETIEGTIERLEEQDSQDTEKQTWCSSELKNNEKTRRRKTVTVDELNADIDRLNASIISLAEDIVSTQGELSASAQAMANATEIRQKEKAANGVTIDEATKAQEAVLEAITVLKEFYGKSGLALLQAPAAPGAYGGMDSSSVVGLLESIAADFARLEADTKAEEESAAREFDQLSKDYKLNKAEKETDLKHLKSNKVEKVSELATKGQELQSGEQELKAALQYFEELKPPCVKGGKAWQEREEQRQEEIKSLRKAMEIIG